MQIISSLLKKINPATGLLRQSMITSMEECPDFGAFTLMMRGLEYPTEQKCKFETYGWVPTLYTRGDYEFTDRKAKPIRKYWMRNIWRRCAEAEAATQSMFYGDVDNEEPGRLMASMDNVGDRLETMGVNHLMHTTYSSSDVKEKFHIFIPTDRDITRDEQKRIFVYLNWEAFDQQGDPAIYDPGDYMYGPPHGCRWREWQGGKALDVELILAAETMLREEHPEAWERVLTRCAATQAVRKPRRIATEAEELKMAKLANDTSVRPFTTIRNPEIWNPKWTAEYTDLVVDRKHWPTMRSLIGKVWLKSGGSLSYGEMSKLFGEIDALDGGYFLKKYTWEGAEDIIGFVMDQVVDERKASKLYHRNLFDSSLIRSWQIDEYLRSDDPEALDKLMADLIQVAIDGELELSEDAWMHLMNALERLKRTKQ